MGSAWSSDDGQWTMVMIGEGVTYIDGSPEDEEAEVCW
jgi:hypothetical protein